MNRRSLQMRLASLKMKLADLEDLLAAELYAKGVNKDQTEYSPITDTPYGEGFLVRVRQMILLLKRITMNYIMK